MGPVPLVSIASLFSLLAGVLRWRHDRSVWWVIPLALLALGTPLLTAYREVAGYLLMGLVLQPLTLWVVSPLLTKANRWPSTRQHQLRWVFVGAVLPSVWFASCAYGWIGEVNERIAKLESLPVPAGAVVVEKSAVPWRVINVQDNILYRVPLPLEQAEAEVYRLFEAEGWGLLSTDKVGRDRDCISVHMQSWTWSPEWSSSDNTQLRISLC